MSTSVETFPGQEWQAVAPEAAGLDAAALERARSWLDARAGEEGRYRVLIVRGGRVAAEWQRGIPPDERILTHSVVKSVYSCLLGIAIADGRLPSADARVVDFYPEAMEVPQGRGPKPGSYAFPKDRAITFRQLISNTSGYLKAGEEPGRVFHYQTYGMTILAHALGKIYGLYDVAAPERSAFHELVTSRIRDPIGASWAYQQGNFDLHPQARIEVFGYNESIAATARDLARLGWLWRAGGRWGERQIVPAAWLAEATRTAPDILRHCPAEEHLFGHGFWTNDQGRLFPDLPRDSFASWGTDRKTRSQHIWVCPSLDLVVVQGPAPWIEQHEGSGELLGSVVAALR